MANSRWTMEHVAQLFWARRPPARVWPPCDTADLAALPLQRKLKRLYLVSLAQVPNSQTERIRPRTNVTLVSSGWKTAEVCKARDSITGSPDASSMVS